MRVQHNIMAMNAYRNYNNNTKALSGNLEKLSSGYKINRAGDDAAGLAISEKMRSQITGLDAAQKNVKDGISLVKTAEGAMQEVQDMLKRMKYLAVQSANGTYQDEVDRENLQKEVESLKTEINRIADSANFNGIKLLDGSMAGSGGGGSSTVAAPTVTGFELTPVDGAKDKAAATLASATGVGMGSFNVTVDVNGKSYTYTYDVKPTSAGAKLGIFDSTGKKVSTTDGNIKYSNNVLLKQTGAEISAAALASDVAKRLQKELGSDFKVDGAGGKITIEAANNGANTVKFGGVNVSYTEDDGKTTANVTAAAALAVTGVDDTWTVTATTFKKATKASAIGDSTYSINGVKFAFMTNAEQISKVKDSSINIIQLTPGATKADEIAAQIRQLTGADARVDTAGTITFYASKGSTGGGGGLTLQIGDTADSYNQMQVKIGDMHTTGGMGIDGIDIGTLAGAQAAIEVVTDATNYVSSIRGDLGAIQNRLDHTLNNLSVMAENIQDAESTIRDTDVAEEMMAYTKNNILIQSAQAMLAQANQVPQGVLQLLG